MASESGFIKIATGESCLIRITTPTPDKKKSNFQEDGKPTKYDYWYRVERLNREWVPMPREYNGKQMRTWILSASERINRMIQGHRVKSGMVLLMHRPQEKVYNLWEVDQKRHDYITPVLDPWDAPDGFTILTGSTVAATPTPKASTEQTEEPRRSTLAVTQLDRAWLQGTAMAINLKVVQLHPGLADVEWAGEDARTLMISMSRIMETLSPTGAIEVIERCERILKAKGAWPYPYEDPHVEGEAPSPGLAHYWRRLELKPGAKDPLGRTVYNPQQEQGNGEQQGAPQGARGRARRQRAGNEAG